MNIEKDNKQDLVNYRIKQANDTIEVVELLIRNERYPSAVNRIYYGMFYSLLALALKSEFESSKHQQLIGWFNKEFIKTKKIDTDFGRILKISYENRTKGDYDSFIEFDKEQVLQLFEEMKRFIVEIEKHLD
ncbi:MAG: HEPN domain-containing protein [Bacteroidales bacterium]|nr:HEPN domain-containing protein [Bacteroidales bacterium]